MRINIRILVLLLPILTVGCDAVEKNKRVAPLQGDLKSKSMKVYEPNWESLGHHNESPNWFSEAKLGIYFHWGVYSVPAFDDEWYPRNMHKKDHRVYRHHVEKYGQPSEFGYHDFIPMFKAEKFDPEEWAELFKNSGARFAGPVAEHHDGFSMWDSDVNPWNVVDMGPKRDITGELQKAITSRGMKFIATFHHSKQLQRAEKLNEPVDISHYPYMDGMPPSSNDPELAILYGNIPAEKWYQEFWLGKLKEVIDGYQPDIVWFDYVLDAIPEAYRQEFSAYYLNEAKKWDKDVVIVRKQHDLPLSMSVDDLEQSRKNVIGTKTWMTDATVSNGSWCYTENLKVKPPKDVLHMLVDITSKNGVLLLNISPKADGSIPENQKEILTELGAWLNKYGEAIYGTEAWYTFGEGPTKEPHGHYQNHDAFHKLRYSNKDIRYTAKDYNIYAIIMGATDSGQDILLKAFSKKNIIDQVTIEELTILGTDEVVEWLMDEEGIKIKAPTKKVDDMATVIKIRTSA
ncbi:alpha-L-fucosidase [Seonamhaeicola sp.]|uniref:alpha-L-fucosidase n=1 Tax=Seonamhaeicola sp. TaxID=1912245 RepID=UPI0026337613|nr:alpha-L-fucosidase [Seonamhaeicola sp.]